MAASVSDPTAAEGAACQQTDAGPPRPERTCGTCLVRFEAPLQALKRMQREAPEILRKALGRVNISSLPTIHGLALVQVPVPDSLLRNVLRTGNDWLTHNARDGLVSVAPTRAQLEDPDFIIVIPKAESRWAPPIPPVREDPMPGWAADFVVYGTDLFSAACLDHTVVQAPPTRDHSRDGAGRGRGRGKTAPPQGPRRPALRVWWHTEATRADALLLAIVSGLRPVYGVHAWTKDVVWATLQVGLDRAAWHDDKSAFVAELHRLLRTEEDLQPIVADGADGASITVCLPAGLVKDAVLHALPETVGSGARVVYRGLPAEDGRSGMGRGMGSPVAESDVAQCGAS
jgi:hypothetical protein